LVICQLNIILKKTNQEIQVEAKVDQLKKMLEDRDMEVLFARVASTLLNKGNTEEALKICEAGIKKYPMYAQGHYILASCYDQQDKSDQARTEYERVIKYDPNHLKAIKRLAEIYQASGLDDQSKEKIAILQILDPFDDDVYKMAQAAGVADEKLVTDDLVEPESLLTEESDAAKSDPLDVDKVDLSQFDNQEDDFTTIIQGKQEVVEDKTDEDENIKLSLGMAAEDLVTDTDANNRVAYEEEIRLRKESKTRGSDDDGEYEDLDELQFEKEDSDRPDKEDHEDWVTPTGENDATEILLKKDESKPDRSTDEVTAHPENTAGKDARDSSEYHQPKIVTQTLGEILVSQKKYVEALRVFETLQEQHPDNKNISKKVDFLKKIVVLEQK
jgi:tetratricopeptide (TPR) repeat protein